MNKLANIFRHKAFIPFITAGDPNLQVTEALVLTMAEAGADMIELGIPFSDPIAGGNVIQMADERALKVGTTTDAIFAMVKRIRKKTVVPLAFITYMNPVYSYGTERFLTNCKDCNVDALIVPDLPFEEKEEVLPHCQKHGITLISMIAPTSQERIRMIAAEAEGFVYCISPIDLTGMRRAITTDLQQMLAIVKSMKEIPCAVDLGISTPEQAAQIAQIADGIIVSSAIVKLVQQYGEAAVGPVRAYVHAMVKAVRG